MRWQNHCPLRDVLTSTYDGSEDRTISFTVSGRPVSFRGLPYLVYFVLPNVYFHVTTTYAILRHNGVELGKMDFLGDIQ